MDIRSALVEDIDKIVKERNSSNEKVNSKDMLKLANRYFKQLPKETDDFVYLVNEFIERGNWIYFNIVTLWYKKRLDAIDIKYLDTYVNWVENYVKGWGSCDQLCYRVINPLVEKYPELYSLIKKWSESNNKDMRRVSLVAFIRTGRGLQVYYDFDKVLAIIEKLKDDSDIHVQKAVGWVLKCSYETYKVEVVDYLRKNVKNLSRLIFRYSLENMPKELKKELMSLDYKK